MTTSVSFSPMPQVLDAEAAFMQALRAELPASNRPLYNYTRLVEDLFLDPMDVQLLIASLESKLDYYLTDEEMAQIETVGDLRHYFLR